MNTANLFKKALWNILNTEECDHIINISGREERKAIERMREFLKGKEAEDIHFLMLLPELHKAPNLLCDILTIMMMIEDEEE